MIKPMWDSKAVKAYETGQGVELVNEPYPHYAPSQKKREWVGLTEEDLKLLSAEWRIVYGAWMDDFARDIEAKLKERNI